MEDLYGIKELYDVTFRALSPQKIGNKSFETNEVLLRFNTVSLAAVNASPSRRFARGGQNNTIQVGWESTENVQFQLSQGKFSQTQLGAFVNMKMAELETGTCVVPMTQELESDVGGHVNLKFPPILDNNTLRIYDAATGARITNFTLEDDNLLITPYTSILIDYTFLYTSKATIYKLGTSLINGFCKLEGKMRIKNENGSTQTGIVTIPKFQLMSDLRITLGTDAQFPFVGTLQGLGFATGDKHAPSVLSITWLDQELDGEDLV